MTPQAPIEKSDTAIGAESVLSAKHCILEPAAREGRSWVGPRVLGIGSLAAVTLAGALTAGTLPRLRQVHEVNAVAAEVASARPRVTVTVARQVAPDAERVLPGNALPLLEASLYARTTGYLKTRLVDIGDHVKEGRLLAEISAPDIDDQLAQAQANLVQAKANLARAQADDVFARSEQNRYRRLVGPQAVSQEEYESKVQAAGVTAAVVGAMEASIKVNEAAVQRYADLQAFQKITAPFPGVVTARNVDPGDLISADSPNTTKELFHLMRTDVLRVFVNVPQVFSTGIKAGQDTVVFRREEPTKLFKGKVTRTADALDPATRTLLTEVQVPNPDNALRPGMYLQVKFVFDRQSFPVLIPTAALVTRSEGPMVAVLDNQQVVRYHKVQLGRDYGSEIQVLAGLSAGETVIVHPGNDLPEGAAVEPVALPTK
jgi:RND family efflux transporter MFP subunit